MAGADLKDAARTPMPNDGIERGAVEAWEPVLAPARRRRRAVERLQLLAYGVDVPEPFKHSRHAGLEQRLERRVGHGRHVGCMAVRNEVATRGAAEQRTQAKAKAP